MKKIALFLMVLGSHLSSEAQVRFIYAGNIEFERRINVHRQMSGANNEWMKKAAEQLPQFRSSTFTLSFDSTYTLYQYVPGPPAPAMISFLGPAKENAVLTNLQTGLTESRKEVFDEKFVVIDTLRKMEWTMSNERRMIAGFECRKAVGRICDSVYVVAFFAEEIPVSGGPESFSGLPGMILGLVVPRLYTTWFATKLSLAPTARELPKTGRREETVDRKKLESVLVTSMKNWGDYAQKYIWWAVL